MKNNYHTYNKWILFSQNGKYVGIEFEEDARLFGLVENGKVKTIYPNSFEYDIPPIPLDETLYGYNYRYIRYKGGIYEFWACNAPFVYNGGGIVPTRDNLQYYYTLVNNTWSYSGTWTAGWNLDYSQLIWNNTDVHYEDRTSESLKGELWKKYNSTIHMCNYSDAGALENDCRFTFKFENYDEFSYADYCNSNVPLFDNADDGNHYLKTGDYSKALNKEDLKPAPKPTAGEITEEQRKIIDDDATRKTITLSFPNNEVQDITNNKIYQESMIITETLLDSDNLIFGKCSGSMFQIKVADFTEDIDNAKMDVSIAFTNDQLGNFELEIGKYIVLTSERTSDKRFRIITATDYMSLFDKDITDWYNDELFPVNVVEEDYGWIVEDENGSKIKLTYSKSGVPETSLIENDNGAYYLDIATGYIYVGRANYDSQNLFLNVTWEKYIECKKNNKYKEKCDVTRSINDILSMLCERVGVSYDNEFNLINGSLSVGRNFSPEVLKGRDLLEQICEANGVFGHFVGEKLTFIAPSYESTINEVSLYKSCEFNENDVKKINCLQIKTDNSDVGVTITRSGITKLNKYVISGNVLFYGISDLETLEAAANNILSVIENVQFRPQETVVKGGVYLGLGSPIRVHAKVVKENEVKDVSFDAIVLQRTISGIQGLSTRIESSGNEYQDVNAQSLSSQISILNDSARELTRNLTALTADFNSMYADSITTENLVANVASIDHLDANSALIGLLNATYIYADNLAANVADIETLNADSAFMRFLSSEYATIAQLNATNANITNLQTFEADIRNLIFGSASGTTITTEFSNSVVAQIGNAQIQSAMIDTISADKILGGSIYTNKVHIYGDENNKLSIVDNTLAISDGTHTRVQIGKDASNDYNMYVWDRNGKLMFDALGLTVDGVTRKVIRDDVVQDNANISASKLNVESLFNVINNDSSHTLKSTKVYFDDEKQTLDVAFKSMTTTVNDLQATQSSQGTQISTIQGQISSKIWQQDITSAVNPLNESVTALSTQYSTLNQTVNGIQTTVGSHTTSINGLDTRVSNAESTISQQSEMISSKVSKDSVVSEINQSAETIKIAASKLELSGYLTISSADSTYATQSALSQLSNSSQKRYLYTADLSSSAYDVNTYYPVYKDILKGGFHDYEVAVQLDSYTKPPWSWHDLGFSCDLKITVQACGWGTTNGTGWISVNEYSACDKMPAYVTQVTYASWIVFYLRGGGRYYLYSDDSANWQIATSAIDYYGQVIAPTTTPSNGYEYAPLQNIGAWCADNDITMIDGGKLYTGSVKAYSIDVNNLFAQNITATGTITGAKLYGTHIEADSGYIGDWSIIDGTISNEYINGSITRKAILNADSTLLFQTINQTNNPTLLITGDGIDIDDSNFSFDISTGKLEIYAKTIYGNPKSSITPTEIIENNEALSSKYIGKDGFKTVAYTYASVEIAANGTATANPTATNIPSGYSVAAVRNVGGGSGAVLFRSFSLGGTIQLVNRSSSKVNCTPSMSVLCIKSSFLN